MKIRILKTNRKCPVSFWKFNPIVSTPYYIPGWPKPTIVHTGTTKREIWESNVLDLKPKTATEIVKYAQVTSPEAFAATMDQINRLVNKPSWWQRWRKR